MATGDYELRQIEWSAATVAVVSLTLVSAAINFAFATTSEQRVFAILALGLLVGFIAFFTDVWSPIMYLVGAVYVAIMAGVGVLVGMPMLMIGLLDTVVQGVLVSLCCYRFLVERSASSIDAT